MAEIFLPTMTPLRQRLIQDMQLRNYSQETIRSYVHWLSQFAHYSRRSPAVLTPEHARLLTAWTLWSGWRQEIAVRRKAKVQPTGPTSDAPFDSDRSP